MIYYKRRWSADRAQVERRWSAGET